MASEDDLRRAQYFIRHIEMYEGHEIEELAKQFEQVRDAEWKRVWDGAIDVLASMFNLKLARDKKRLVSDGGEKVMDSIDTLDNAEIKPASDGRVRVRLGDTFHYFTKYDALKMIWMLYSAINPSVTYEEITVRRADFAPEESARDNEKAGE